MEFGREYLRAAREILDRVEATQMEAIARAAEMCAESIAAGGLAHLFGSGHSRMAVEEIFPRYGSFPGFHPIVDLSLTFHTQVVGANGQRQAMFLERIEGFGQVILRNFVFGPHDSFMVFSNGGVNEVVIDVALSAKERGMPVIAVCSAAHCQASKPRHSSVAGRSGSKRKPPTNKGPVHSRWAGSSISASSISARQACAVLLLMS